MVRRQRRPRATATENAVQLQWPTRMTAQNEHHPLVPITDAEVEEWVRAALGETNKSRRRRLFDKFALAALGSIPWVGGFLSAVASFKDEEGQLQVNELHGQWIAEHSGKLDRLGKAFLDVFARLENFGEEIDARLESEEYLGLVRQAFRSWDRADTEQKREFAKRLITNTAATRICSDDVVRLFLQWIDTYHEIHFAVIRVIFRQPGASRAEIWSQVGGPQPREDSAEADLFKLLIRDLSTGSVIRQHREVDAWGNFVKRPTRRGQGKSSTMKSAFDPGDPYELTELGRQFVHYVMVDVVPQIGAGAPGGAV